MERAESYAKAVKPVAPSASHSIASATLGPSVREEIGCWVKTQQQYTGSDLMNCHTKWSLYHVIRRTKAYRFK
jgi:hypothetical protein